ncbi:MAG: tetratricopeptide (TPR) repeat protein [Brevundimonas sp.]|uniref:tetratricopeptide repeat protein n=1 Tax=Brevundimonas sp. TaxID=1871086 RepID=UPI0039E42375
MRARHLLIAILAASLGGAPTQARQDDLHPALAAASETDRTELMRLETEALALVDAGDAAGADALLDQLLTLELRVYGPDHPLVANTHAFRADLAERGGDLARAEALRRLELPIRERAGDALALAETQRALGALLVAGERHAEALAVLEPAHAVMAAQLEPAEDRYISAAYNLGRSYYRLERPEAALTVLASAARTLSDPLHRGSIWAPLVAHEYGFILAEQTRHEDAVPFLGLACEQWSLPSETQMGWPGEACLDTAEALIALERSAEAEPWLERALADPNLSAGRRSNGAEHLIRLRTADGGPGADEALLRTALDASTEAWGADHAATAYAANRLGLWLRDGEQRNAEALPLFEQAQAAYAASQGPGGQGVMAVTTNLAYTLTALNRADEAVSRAEAVQRAVSPQSVQDPAAISSWWSLALAKTEALLDAGRTDEARSELTALADWLAGPGGGDARLLADTHMRIAQAAARQRDWPVMVEQRRLSLEYQRQVDDPASLVMAMAYYGHVLGEVGETEAGYQHLGEALTLLGQVDDITEDERLYVMLHFGVAARRMGRLEEAAPLLEAVVARRRAAGEAGPLSFALSHLADLRTDQNRFPESEALYLEARDLVEEDAEAASFINTDLGELWRFMGRVEEAEAALREVVDYTTARYGSDSLDTAVALRNLANHLDVTGRKARALDMLLQVQAIEAAHLSPDDSQRMTTALRIAGVLTDLGRYEEAEAALVPALELAVQQEGGDARLAQELSAQLGFVVARQGRYGDAIDLLRGAVRLAERRSGPDGRDLINALQLLSYALYMDGRYQETLEILTRTERIADAQGARWPSTVVDVKGNLGRTYVEAGRPREALPPLREAVVLAARLTREQATASGVRAEIDRAPFRTLVDAAWDAAALH